MIVRRQDDNYNEICKHLVVDNCSVIVLQFVPRNSERMEEHMRKQRKTVLRTIRITPEQLRKLMVLAETFEVTPNHVVGELIDRVDIQPEHIDYRTPTLVQQY